VLSLIVHEYIDWSIGAFTCLFCNKGYWCSWIGSWDMCSGWRWKHKETCSMGAFGPQQQPLYRRGRRRSLAAWPGLNVAGEAPPACPSPMPGCDWQAVPPQSWDGADRSQPLETWSSNLNLGLRSMWGRAPQGRMLSGSVAEPSEFNPVRSPLSPPAHKEHERDKSW